MKQRERLSKLYQRTLKERNFILNKKNHAELILQNLEHSVVSTTTKYVTCCLYSLPVYLFKLFKMIL